MDNSTLSDIENFEVEKGDAALDNGEYDLAAHYYERARQQDPHDLELVLKTGDAYSRHSDFKKAIATYRDAEAHLSDFDQDTYYVGLIYINLGEIFIEQHQFDQAFEYFEKAKQLDVTEARYHSSVGNALFKQEKYEKALAHYLQQTELAPEDSDGFLNLAKAHRRLKEYDSAEKALAKARMLSPDEVFVDIEFGNLANDKGDFERALHHFLDAAKLSPNDAAVTYSIGSAYIYLKQYEEAKIVLSQTLQRRPNDSKTLYSLSVAEHGLNNDRKAIALLKAAILADPQNDLAYPFLATLQAQSKKRLDGWYTLFKWLKSGSSRQSA